MAEFLLVNPRRRKKRRKMSAKQRMYFGGGRRRKSNPRRRRARSATRVRRRRNPSRRQAIGYTVGSRRIRRRKLNPSLRGGLRSLTSGFVPTAKAGLIGALGGIGLDLAWGYGSTYLPQALTGPYTKYLAKLAGAMLVGFVGGKVLKGRGTALAQGAMTVVLHEALKEQLAANTSLPLGEYLSAGPIVGAGLKVALPGTTGMGEYLYTGDAEQVYA